MPPFTGNDYDSGMEIYTLDLTYQHVPQSIAAYLVIGAGAVLVETGPGSTRDTLANQLAAHGVAIPDLQAAFVTHIHLDHAGAAGWLAQQGVPVFVHPVGAPHLVDPSKLLASAGRIYGDQMNTLWGETLAAPADKVTAVGDGESIRVAGLSFTAVDTPGHAWHHHTWRLGDIGFTGDAAGIRIGGMEYVDLPAPPPEFKLEAWLQTLDRLQAARFETLYPTHFGRVDRPDEQIDSFRALLLAASEFVRVRLADGMDRDTLLNDYLVWNRQMRVDFGLDTEQILTYDTANPLYMSVDGISRYWQRRWQKERHA